MKNLHFYCPTCNQARAPIQSYGSSDPYANVRSHLCERCGDILIDSSPPKKNPTSAISTGLIDASVKELKQEHSAAPPPRTQLKDNKRKPPPKKRCISCARVFPASNIVDQRCKRCLKEESRRERHRKFQNELEERRIERAKENERFRRIAERESRQKQEKKREKSAAHRSRLANMSWGERCAGPVGGGLLAGGIMATFNGYYAIDGIVNLHRMFQVGASLFLGICFAFIGWLAYRTAEE